MIPPDLLDKLSKKGFKKLIADKTVRFSSLQYLVVNPVAVTINGNGEDELDISLSNYVLLSPDNIPLDDKDKEKLQKVMEQDPLSLIEYWSIDPDYDGETFRSTWQDYRENVDNDSDPLHCVYSTRLTMPHKENRKVCVKAFAVLVRETFMRVSDKPSSISSISMRCLPLSSFMMTCRNKDLWLWMKARLVQVEPWATSSPWA